MLNLLCIFKSCLSAGSCQNKSMPKNKFLILLCLIFSTAGCGQRLNYVESGIVGGAIGAGTGAIVGTIISNGDVGQSALLGTAIGFPVGIAFAAIQEAYITYNSESYAAKKQIIQNSNEIGQREEIIQALRERIKDNQPGDPDPSLREDVFDGPTIGNPYRL
jgi:hypothetical protein